MATYQITAPDGGKYEVTAPDGASEQEVLAYAQQNYKGASAPAAPKGPENGAATNFGKGVAQAVKQDMVAGPAQFVGRAVQGAIGLIPGIKDTDYWKKIQANAVNMDRLMKQDEATYQAETPGSVAAGAGRVLGNVAGGMAIGGGKLVDLGAKAGRAGAGLLGMSETAGGLLGQAAGSAGLGGLFGAAAPVNQEGDYWTQKGAQIGTGAAVGGALPLVSAGTKKVFGDAYRALTPGPVSREVADLAQQARKQGIDLRVDQVASSKPLNVVSATLDYVPFSGKGASLANQQKQFNTAVARTMGEDTPNVVQAVKQAETRLGGEFDRILKSTPVKVDAPLQDDLLRIMDEARVQSTDPQYGVLARQVDYLLAKVQSGDTIDGNAAYNIKKGLDRLGKSNDSTIAHFSREIRGALMDALNRSLPDEGAEFAKVRRQWGNMTEIGKIVGNGAEGDLSPARLANRRDLRSPELSQLADISAQFLRPRVGDSGSAQRHIYGAGLFGAGTIADPVSTGLGVTLGRMLNSRLSNQAVVDNIIRKSIDPAVLNAGGSLAANPVPQSLMNRLSPYLVPAGTIALTTGLNNP